MKLPPHRRHFHLHIGDVAFLLVVAASFLALFTSSSSRFTPFEVIVLVAMGIVFVLIGTLGFEKVDYSKSRALVVASFGVQIGLGAAILFVSRAAGLIGFCMLPLAAHSVVCLPKRGMLIV